MASSQEAEMKTFDHITRDPAMLGGQPTVRGMRLTVRRVVSTNVSNQTGVQAAIKRYPMSPKTRKATRSLSIDNVIGHLDLWRGLALALLINVVDQPDPTKRPPDR
jgi:uncharacterized protein (DUF433 family)